MRTRPLAVTLSLTLAVASSADTIVQEGGLSGSAGPPTEHLIELDWTQDLSEAWTDWVNLGGTIKGGPAAASWAPNRLDVFARGMDDAI